MSGPRGADNSLSAVDPVWESVYATGSQLNRYPFDSVVSFVCRHRPRDREPEETDILEVGFGTGANLWFAAREGFRVAGVEGSATAVRHARQRFDGDGLSGDLRDGDFTQLPFASSQFDLAIDRCAITCVGKSSARRAVGELARVLRPRGRLFLNVYSDEDTSTQAGTAGDDGLTVGIEQGPLAGVGPLAFYDRGALGDLLQGLFEPIEVHHLNISREGSGAAWNHAEWRVVGESLPAS